MRINGFFERRFDPPAPFVKAVVMFRCSMRMMPLYSD